jgi:hypothetical protein
LNTISAILIAIREVQDSAKRIPMENVDDEWITEIEAKGAAESERRIDAVDRGELPTVDGPTALRELRLSLDKIGAQDAKPLTGETDGAVYPSISPGQNEFSTDEESLTSDSDGLAEMSKTC